MADFGLIKAFDIDDGQLEGQSPQQCFVLGYELAQIDEALKRPFSISKPVHASNRERIEKACQESGRPFILSWIPSDSSEDWMQLDVQEPPLPPGWSEYGPGIGGGG